MKRASLNSAIFGRWPLSAISQESEPRRFCDGGRPGCAAELAADVRDVAVNGVRAQLELLRDFAVPETVRNAGEDLALAI